MWRNNCNWNDKVYEVTTIISWHNVDGPCGEHTRRTHCNMKNSSVDCSRHEIQLLGKWNRILQRLIQAHLFHWKPLWNLICSVESHNELKYFSPLHTSFLTSTVIQSDVLQWLSPVSNYKWRVGNISIAIWNTCSKFQKTIKGLKIYKK